MISVQSIAEHLAEKQGICTIQQDCEMIASRAEIVDLLDSNGYSCINDCGTSMNDPRESLVRSGALLEWTKAATPLEREG